MKKQQIRTLLYSEQCSQRCRSRVWVVLAAFTFTADVAWAQTEESDENVRLDEIVVHGSRLSQRLSIEAKRMAESIMDSVSANDMGRLPDKNAAEAIDRLPGVSISTDQGEGRFVSIRGINPTLNNLTINGVNSGSPEADDGGRLAPLDVIGGDFLKSIEVIKAQTPDMDAQGIGGTVNVVTAGPFDQGEPLFVSASGQLGYEELSGNSPYAAKMTVGGLNSDETWGWLVGGSYSYRDFESVGVFQDDWREETVGGVTASLPENSKNNFYNLERTRTGANAQLEWRPTDDSKYFARAFFSRFVEDENRQRYEHLFNRDITVLAENSGTSGTNNRREQDARLEEKDKSFFNIAIGGENRVADSWLLDYVAQFNRNEQTEPNRRWEFRGSDYGPDTWTINSQGFALITGGPAGLQDASLIRFRRALFQDNKTEEDAAIFAFNARKDLGFSENATYVKFGVKYATTDRMNDASNTRYNLGNTDWFLSEFGHSAGAFTNEVDGIAFPSIRIDFNAATAFFEANRTNTDFFEIDADDTFENEFERDYDISEDVLAGYLMAGWSTGPHEVTVGVRVEQTDVSSTGFQRDEDNLTATPVSQSGDYTNVLPALLYRADIGDDVVFRAAWTNTLGRPDFNEIAPISALNRSGADGSLFIGNPNLEARESVNYDLSLEYYFAEDSLLSVAVFYKDMSNFIVRRSEQFQNFTFNGELFDQFTVTTLENATDASLKGAELSYMQHFDALPLPWNGFGIALAFAFIESEIVLEGRTETLPLIQQPDWTRSYALFYQIGGFEASLAMDESDSFLSDIVGSVEEDLLDGEYGRLDFKASYAFSDNYAAFFEWQNINDEPNTEFQGFDERQNTRHEEYGRTFYLGLTGNF